MSKPIHPRPNTLRPAELRALLSCIPADTWDEPDMGRALSLQGLAHTRYFRYALGLAAAPSDPRTGKVVCGVAEDGTVIGRMYDRVVKPSPKPADKVEFKKVDRQYRIWLWKRFPPGTTSEEVEADARNFRISRLPEEADAATRIRMPPVPLLRDEGPVIPTREELLRRREEITAHYQTEVSLINKQLNLLDEINKNEAAARAAQADLEKARLQYFALTDKA